MDEFFDEMDDEQAGGLKPDTVGCRCRLYYGERKACKE